MNKVDFVQDLPKRFIFKKNLDSIDLNARTNLQNAPQQG